VALPLSCGGFFRGDPRLSPLGQAGRGRSKALFCGSLASLILLNAAAGAVSGGALTDVGINDRFMKELAAILRR
jgi:hypothetical protein